MVYTVENTWKELHEARVNTAIVPFGAVEQHGHHLPLGTDWIIADAMGRALAEALEEDVLLLPATLAAVLDDVVESLRHHGFRTVIVFSAHGGNWILKPTLRELNFRYPELTLLWANGALPEEGETLPEDIHAGREET